MRKVYLIERYDQYARCNWWAVDGGLAYDDEGQALDRIDELIKEYPKDVFGADGPRFRLAPEYRP